MKTVPVRIKKVSSIDYAAIVLQYFNDDDDASVVNCVVLRVQIDGSTQFTVEDFYSYSKIYQVPNIVNYTEEELFQFSLLQDTILDINLVQKLQKYLWDNFKDMTNSTQYEIEVQY